jgi:hypothetical protein
VVSVSEEHTASIFSLKAMRVHRVITQTTQSIFSPRKNLKSYKTQLLKFTNLITIQKRKKRKKKFHFSVLCLVMSKKKKLKLDIRP